MSSPSSPGTALSRDHPQSSRPTLPPLRTCSLLKGWQINLHNSQRALDILSKHLEEDRQVGVVAICEPPWFLRRGSSIHRFRNIRALAHSEE